ncbi:hypothetical protein TNCV_3173141 [Trichonephila clavipes]|nr:hypothetical protein TNCV_3173141 [Trichonephila clavipes]
MIGTYKYRRYTHKELLRCKTNDWIERFEQGRASLCDDEKSLSTSSHLIQTNTNHCPPFLVSTDRQNGAALSNGLLHPNDYEERRITRCEKVLPTSFHSALDSSNIGKFWKEKLKSSFIF